MSEGASKNRADFQASPRQAGLAKLGEGGFSTRLDSAWAEIERAALGRNDRYLLEFVEALNVCPFAKACREAGKLHREVLPLVALDVASILARVAALEERPPGEVEVALFLFPGLDVTHTEFDHFVADVRRARERARTAPAQFFMVAFHPRLPKDLTTPDRAVTFIRRSPDPTLQLVSMAAIERAREGAGDRRALSAHVAEAGLAAVRERGPDAIEALLAEIQRDGR